MIKTRKQKRFSGRYFQFGVSFFRMEKMSVFQGLTCLEGGKNKKKDLKSCKQFSKFYIRRKMRLALSLRLKKLYSLNNNLHMTFKFSGGVQNWVSLLSMFCLILWPLSHALGLYPTSWPKLELCQARLTRPGCRMGLRALRPFI